MATENTQPDSGKKTDAGRRTFLKLGVVGAGAVAAAAGGMTVVKRMEGIPHEAFPLPIREDFRPIDQRNVVLTFAHSKALNEKHPERIKKFDNFPFYERHEDFMKAPYRDEPGYTQLERALAMGGFSGALGQTPSVDATNSGVGSWEQRMLADTKYEFKDPKEAALAIKSAARTYGALRCGITKRDRRWDYQPIYDWQNERELSWEQDFPFEPKSVIVLMVEMDFHAMAAAPSWMADATVGNAYANGIKIAGQMAVFLRQLGYRAVASLNDLGVNGPYAIASGLGEAARNGQVITPKYGPRVRISKVYTDFDFVEHDKARTFGVASFCRNCKRCAVSCPSQAITHEDPTWEPTYSSDPEYTWNAAPGVLKFHNDAKKCFKFWIENDGGCANCICACPYNKPDFWHHRLVDAQNVIAPGPVHVLMREMDILFGYGKVSDPDRVRKFWKLGKHV